MAADEPVSALIGVSALGFGALLAYGAYRNVPVLGSQGLLTGALQTGKLQPVVYGGPAAQARAKAEAAAQKKQGTIGGSLVTTFEKYIDPLYYLKKLFG